MYISVVDTEVSQGCVLCIPRYIISLNRNVPAAGLYTGAPRNPVAEGTHTACTYTVTQEWRTVLSPSVSKLTSGTGVPSSSSFSACYSMMLTQYSLGVPVTAHHEAIPGSAMPSMSVLPANNATACAQHDERNNGSEDLPQRPERGSEKELAPPFSPASDISDCPHTDHITEAYMEVKAEALDNVKCTFFIDGQAKRVQKRWA